MFKRMVANKVCQTHSNNKNVGDKRVKAKKSLNSCHSITKNHSATSCRHKNGIALKSNFDFACLLYKCYI